MEKDREKKNIVQDILPSKRSIRNVEIPLRPQKISAGRVLGKETPDILPPKTPNFEKKVPIKKIVQGDVNEVPSTIPPVSKNTYRYDFGTPKKKSKLTFYVSLSVFVLVCAFGVSAFFKNAKITITPENETKTLDTTTYFTAKKNDPGADLAFQIVTITKDLEKTVPSDGESQVNTKASGRIVIYNTTTQVQKLVAQTRFQTPEGLIYKIQNAISIPASQLKNSKSIPGSVEVTVYADATGDKYNVGMKDFTIPGFKGSAKYTQITAKSKTEMTGGFSGIQKTVSNELKASTDSELDKSLRDALASDIVLQIPDNYILYSNGISYVLSSTTQVDSKDNNVVLQKKGVANAVIFDRGALTRMIVSKLLPEEKEDMIKINNLDKLTFSFKDGNSFNPAQSDTLNFNLSGDALLVWVFDENKLESDLLGLTKTQARSLISTYKSIKEAWITTSPFWNQTIPKDSKKVEFINTLSK